MQQTPPRLAASTTSVLTIFGISPHKSSLKRQITEDHPQISPSSTVRSISRGFQSPSLGNAWSETARHASVASARSSSPVSESSTAPVTLQDYQTPSTSICNEDTIEYTPTTLRRLRGGVKKPPKPKVAQTKARMSALIESDDELAAPVPATSKKHIRKNIANDTTVRRNQFLIEKKEYWLPLLPANNHVQKLVEKHERRTAAERASMPAVCPYDELTSQPRGIKAEMKPYQLSGLSFLVYLQRNGLAGILGDEMGLGKTLQTISLVQYLKESTLGSGTGNLQRPCLVVCPLSVLSSWMAETKRWAPNLRVLRFHGPIKERVRMKKIVVGEIDMFGRPVAKGGAMKSTYVNGDVRDETVGVDLVVTTYESFRAEQAWFKRAFVWRYVILDEGHMVKNAASLVSKSLQGIRAEYRLILTGTPLQNNLAELWSLLHWLYPEVFTDKTRGIFDTSFNLTKGQFSHEVLDSAKCLLELIMLRRMKNSPGVDLNLPPKTDIIMYVPLTPMQLFWYKRMITKADSMLLEDLFSDVRSKEEQVIREDTESEHGIGQRAWDESRAILMETVRREHEVCDQTNKSSRWQNLMNLVMRLRQVSNHPYQITGAAPDPYFAGDHVITASGKFIVLEKLVQELVVRQKKRILIFSGFTFMLDFVEELLRLRGGDGSKFRFARIDGSTCRARRNLSIRMLNDLTTDYRVMLISTRAGGLGINLASASDVVLLDQDWNPQITLQAESRAHRIGQKNPVTVYKLISQGTVEEQMMGRIQKKLYLSAKVTEAMQDIHTQFQSSTRVKSDMSTDDMPELSVGQLMTLVRRGATAIARPPVDLIEMQAWDWETTVNKCRDQPADVSIKEGSDADAEAERAWLTEMERVEASIFEGAKLTKGDKRSNKDVSRVEEIRKEDRRIGKNVTVMIDGFAVSKDTVDCAPWEAVKTMAGQDPRLAEPVRAKKAAIESQSHCQSCFEYGTVVLCQLCPRVYHVECLDGEFQAKTQRWQFVCPQHECFDCAQKTTEAGGMLYRCRWCDKAFCEDCADLSVTRFHGDILPELAALDYPEQTQAYYVTCHVCEVDTHAETLAFRRTWEAQFEAEYREKSGMLNDASPSDETASISGASLTDAATIDTPGICTPSIVDEDDKDGLKRKMTSMNGVSQNGLKRVRHA